MLSELEPFSASESDVLHEEDPGGTLSFNCFMRDLITSFAALFFLDSSLASSVASFNWAAVLSNSDAKKFDLRLRISTYVEKLLQALISRLRN